MWSSVTARGNIQIPLRGAFTRATGRAVTRKASRRGFCFPPSGRELAQQMGECRRRTHKSDAAHDPSGAALCRDRSEQASKPTMRLTHERVPGSTNAPSLTSSRPTVLFLRWKLAEAPCMSGVSGSAMSAQNLTKGQLRGSVGKVTKAKGELWQ
jgi:hypothetical protein